MHEDEIYWSIRWSGCEGLVPDLSMIPDRSVFLYASQGRSLAATVEGVTSLLLSFSDNRCTTGSISESSWLEVPQTSLAREVTLDFVSKR